MFVMIERAKGQHALAPPSMFATSIFTGLTILTFLLYAALGGLTVVLPFFLIRGAGYSASAAGAALLPIPIVIGLGSRLVGQFSHFLGPRRLLAGGSLVVAIGLLLYAVVPAQGLDYWRHVMPATLLVAIGMGLCVAPLTTAVMDSVDAAHIGAASGLNSATARVGGLVASALLAFIFVRQDSNQQLVEAFRSAAVMGSMICAVAAASVVFLLRQPDVR
jgi:MFS family permease